MVLYHGTIDIYANDIMTNGIKLNKSKSFLDFGPGFYTTPSYEFAKNTAKLRAKRYNYFRKNRSVGWKVIELVCDDCEFSKLTIKSFSEADGERGKFVIANRCENNHIRSAYDNNISRIYDAVTGPVADGVGTLTPILEQVNKGILLIDDVDYSLIAPSKSSNWGSQISFNTEKSLSCITEIRML